MQGGRERDEDKECKAKECAFRHVLRPNPSSFGLNLIGKNRFERNIFPFIYTEPLLVMLKGSCIVIPSHTAHTTFTLKSER